MKKLPVSFLLLISALTYGQEKQWDAGFRIITIYDSSRIYKPGTSVSDVLHYRRIDIDLWYPARKGSSDSILLFSDLVHLLETRAKIYDDTEDYTGLSKELLGFIGAAQASGDTSHLRKLPTQSFVHALPDDSNSSLIIYLAALNGMSYENYRLFESLARKGFTVAAISSIGRYPGNMSQEIEDVKQQAQDAKQAYYFLRKNYSFKDPTGLISYSWGSIAAIHLINQHPDIFEGFVSLDGSQHNDDSPYEIRNDIAVPYLSLYNGERTINHNTLTPNRIFVKITGAEHEDFSIIGNPQLHEKIIRLSVDFFLKCLKKETQDALHFEYVNRLEKDTPGEHSTLNVTGTVADTYAGKPLAYVNIGIPGKGIGTVSDALGNFNLKVGQAEADDTLRFSMVGYSSRSFLLSEWKNGSTIRLEEKTSALAELTVSAKKLKTKVLGNTARSKFFGGKFSSDNLGSEVAIRINLGRRPMILRTLRFHISYNTEDTTVFRFNVYNVTGGQPGVNLLNHNIMITLLPRQTGIVEVDLLPYRITISDDAFIGLEYIEGGNNSGIVFSASVANHPGFHRKASQDRWKKYPLGVGLHVVGEYHD